MIINGYYYPDKIFKHLFHMDYITREIVGDASVGICFGNRTAGKTVGVGITLMERFLMYDERCMILCRTDKEKAAGYLRKFWQKIFNVDDRDGVITAFQREHKIEFNQDVCAVDGKEFSYCEAISQSAKVKNTGSYNNCRWITMDEAVQKNESFLIIQGRPALERIFEIWQTVARGYTDATKLTNLIFIANIDKITNWLFTDLGLNKLIDFNTKFTAQKSIVYEMVNNENATAAITESGMGMIMQNSVSGVDYYNANVQNEYQDNKSFVMRKPLNFTHLKIQLLCENAFLGVFDINENGYHIAKINEDSRSKIITNDINCHNDNDLYIYEARGSWQESLEALYKVGHLTFNDQESKSMFLHFCSYDN